MIVMLIVLVGLLVPALAVLAFAAYPRQRHKLPPRLDPYPRVEAASERFKPTAERFRPMAERMFTYAERSRPAVNRVRDAVENTDSRLRRLVGESERRSVPPITPVPAAPAARRPSALPPVPPAPSARRDRHGLDALPPPPHHPRARQPEGPGKVTSNW